MKLTCGHVRQASISCGFSQMVSSKKLLSETACNSQMQRLVVLLLHLAAVMHGRNGCGRDGNYPPWSRMGRCRCALSMVKQTMYGWLAASPDDDSNGVGFMQ